jgi:transcriptional regulator with XRE-family HTH domain
MSDARPSWSRLGAELRRLRRQAGRNQEAIAGALGVSKATVERIELGGAHGGSPPSVQAVTDWAQACSVARPDLPALRALAEAALDEHRPFRDWGSLASIQEGIRADEAGAMTLRNFNPWGVPGLLQTAAYAAAVLGMADPRRAGEAPQAVAVRMARQAILHEPGRRLEFLVTEAGLRWRPVAAAGMAAQLAQVASLATSPAVALGVLPLGSPRRTRPDAGFVLYEDRAGGSSPFTAVELPHERVEASTPADVDLYRAKFALLQAEAVTGDDAVEFVREVARSL